MDLTNDYNCLDMKQTVIEKLGGIDILINCAGAIFNGDLENTFP
jgi:short-subunit dehydrogenase